MTIGLLVPDNSLWNRLVQRIREGVAALGEHRVVVLESSSDASCSEVEALVSYRIDTNDLDRMPRLRYLAVPMAGVDTLPIANLRERGVVVVNAHANGRWVAERAVALILAFYGKVIPFHRDLAMERWHGFAAAEPPSESWRSLVGSTVATLGVGSIAQWIARLLAPYEVTVRGFRRRAGGDDLPPGLFTSLHTDLLETVRGADTVIVTLPLTPDTHGLIGTDELEAMRGALLVNVGRGAVVGEEALYNALRSEVLLGAAIDTWYLYPENAAEGVGAPARFPIHTLPNVVLSPHLGGYTPQATTASAQEVVEDLISWVGTGHTARAIDLELAY